MSPFFARLLSLLVGLFSRSSARLFIASALWGCGLEMGAHGDDEQVIDSLTAEILKKPAADLLIQRGELYRHLEDWKKAETDFVAAALLEPKLARVDFHRARSLLEAGDPARAWPLVEQFIANFPEEGEGWFLRGTIQAALGRPGNGAIDYAEGLRRTPNPRPEQYLRRAQLLAAAAPADTATVLAALDEGIARLGPIVSLVNYAITLELEQKDFSAALARIALAIKHAPRREAWLVRQGDVLALAGRNLEAAASYRAALVAIAELPERYRRTAAMEKIAGDTHLSLERLAVK